MLTLTPKVYLPSTLPPAFEITPDLRDAFTLDLFSSYLKELLELREQEHHALIASLERHVGHASVFTQKEELLCILSQLFHIFKDEPCHSKKVGMATMLTQDIDKCTNGFYNRAHELYQSTFSKENLHSWLYDMRVELTDRTARRATKDIHTYNRYFVRASINYGVLPVAPHDAYVGELRDCIIDYDLSHAHIPQ